MSALFFLAGLPVVLFAIVAAAYPKFRRAVRYVLAAVLLKTLFWVLPKDAPMASAAVARLAKEIGRAI